MKFKTSKGNGRMVVELSPRDTRVPLPGSEANWTAPSPIRLKKILVPIDFSECSKKALDYALPFARQFNASLVLLHVLKTPSVIPEDVTAELPMLEAQMLETSKRDIREWADKNLGGTVPIQTQVRLGSPYREIVETARTEDIDLIVMSTHGHTGLKHVFLGSTTESVVRYATCPVFVVRQQEHEFVVRQT